MTTNILPNHDGSVYEHANLKADSPAFTKLCSSSWAVELPRSLITGNTFGAVIVYAAACAWRDRGPPFRHPDDEGGFPRAAAAIPPGGWPALVGVTPQTWRRWRAHAVAANLIHKFSTGPSQLLYPVPETAAGEQFARVEIAVLFHRGLSQRSRRVFMAVSLFRQSNGLSSVSILKIGKDVGLERRDVQRALRELESIGVLQSDGLTSHGAHRYLVNKGAPPVDKSAPLTGDSTRPPLVIKPALSGVFLQESSQELISRAYVTCAEPENPASAPAQTTKDFVEGDPNPTNVAKPESRSTSQKEAALKMQEQMTALANFDNNLSKALERAWRSSVAHREGIKTP